MISTSLQNAHTASVLEMASQICANQGFQRMQKIKRYSKQSFTTTSFSQVLPAALTDFLVFGITEFTVEAEVSQLFKATLMIPGFDRFFHFLKEGDRFEFPPSLLLNMLRRTY
jgi:hypothetical protein